jgi:hypothetical protein
MAVKLKKLSVCLGLAACSGCGWAAHTRFPTLWTSSPAAERRDYSMHDPLPDTTAGPSMGVRPRDGDIQWAEPRRTRSSTVGPWNPYVAPGPTPTPSAFNYPNTVTP